MFNSKELGNRDCKLIQTPNVTVSITNAGFAPGWHHRGSTHHVSFPPTSLLVLASTRRCANHDTRLKPTEDFTTHCILNLLTQLHSSTPHPAVSTSLGLPHSLPQNHQGLASLHLAHLLHTRPPPTRRADDHVIDVTLLNIPQATI